MTDTREIIRIALQNVVNDPTAADAQAILSALAEAGMVVVDLYPADDIVDVAASRLEDGAGGPGCFELRSYWAAMIRAAQEKTNG